jgi:hypothetical protein
MKRVVIGICLVLAVVAGASLVPGRAQEASQRKKPRAIMAKQQPRTGQLVTR